MKLRIAVLLLLMAFLLVCSSPTTDDSTDDSTIVYITNTGTKYHNNGCQYLSESKIAISLKEACAKGYAPCSVCKPPNCKYG